MSILEAAIEHAFAAHRHLIPDHMSGELVGKSFRSLVVDQQRRLDQLRPVSPVPLIWLALAEAAGLQVDVRTGRIVGGPRAEIGHRYGQGGGVPAECPYCKSVDITAHAGHAECRDCGREWSF